MALAITNENYAEIVKTDLPVVIDFWAEWCGPCRMITPIIEELAGEYEGKAVIGKCDVEGADEIIKNGEVVDKQVGACQKKDIVAKLEKLM